MKVFSSNDRSSDYPSGRSPGGERGEKKRKMKSIVRENQEESFDQENSYGGGGDLIKEAKEE